jgi:hypothetical protein
VKRWLGKGVVGPRRLTSKLHGYPGDGHPGGCDSRTETIALEVSSSKRCGGAVRFSKTLTERGAVGSRTSARSALGDVGVSATEVAALRGEAGAVASTA